METIKKLRIPTKECAFSCLKYANFFKKSEDFEGRHIDFDEIENAYK